MNIFLLLKSIRKRIKYFFRYSKAYKKLPIIKDNTATIKELLNTEKSLIRFGDGEFILMEGESLAFQEYDKNLARKLIEIFINEDENLLIGTLWLYYFLPSNLHFNVYTYIYNFLNKYHIKMLKYYNYNKIYYSSFISIVFAQFKKYPFAQHYDLMRKIWDSKEITIITGDRVFNDIEYNIFENAKNINYIFTLTKNAYSNIESIRTKISKIDKNNILIFALGPCGKVLAYEMFKKGYRVLDLGHIIKDYDLYRKHLEKTIQDTEDRLVSFFNPD